jgi:hypothetical protein
MRFADLDIPQETESLELGDVVYSAEMDSETRKFLNELPDKVAKGIVDGLKQSQPTHSPNLEIPIIQNNLQWHRTIGWMVIGCAVIVMLFFADRLFWHSPWPTKEDGGRDTELALAKAMDPVKTQLAVLTVSIEFLKPNPQSNIPHAMLENLRGEDADLDSKTIEALAQRAREEKLKVDVKQVAEVGERLVEQSPKSPSAWHASLVMIGYRSFLSPNPVPVSHPRFRFIDPQFKFQLHLGTEFPLAGC